MLNIERSDCRPVALRDTADLLQALGHPVRLQLLDILWAGPAQVGALVDAVGLSQPTISRHLAILRRANVVSVERHGREATYRLCGCALGLLEVIFPAPSCVADATNRQ